MKIHFQGWIDSDRDQCWDWHCPECYKSNTEYFGVDDLIECNHCSTNFTLVNTKAPSEKWDWKIKHKDLIVKHIRDLYI